MADILAKYGYTPDRDAIDRSLEVIAANLDNIASPEVLKECFGLMDLTSLGTKDSVAHIKAFTEKVNSFAKDFNDYPLPASICVYPNLASTVKENKTCDEVHVTAVAACFPTSQSFVEVKMLEVEMAILGGADEIDIVIPLNKFMAGDSEGTAEEIRRIRECIDKTMDKVGRKITFKVILETGMLMYPEKIAEASFIAMEEGADFIKTSTGKIDVNATPMAAYVMCECIRKFYEKTGKKVGFKAAGGISTALDAASYYSIVTTVLGKEWVNKEYFRFGVSRLANSLLSEIEQKTVSYF